MKRQAMLSLANEYARLLDTNGAKVLRADVDHQCELPSDRLILLSHARWQVEMVRKVIHRLGGESTAIRLLGSVQGIMIALGVRTVGEVWRMNETWLDGASVRAFETAKAELDKSAE